MSYFIAGVQKSQFSSFQTSRILIDFQNPFLQLIALRKNRSLQHMVFPIVQTMLRPDMPCVSCRNTSCRDSESSKSSELTSRFYRPSIENVYSVLAGLMHLWHLQVFPPPKKTPAAMSWLASACMSRQRPSQRNSIPAEIAFFTWIFYSEFFESLKDGDASAVKVAET